MASIRVRLRGNGTTAYNVMYILDGRQTSVTFDSEHAAAEFRDSVNLLGAERAMAAFGIAPTAQAARITSGETVASWVAKYIATRTGVAKSTIYDYEAYLRNDITPTIGAIPLELLTPSDVSGWVNGMSGKSGKTVANKHGLLSAALNEAVAAGKIPSNPAAGTRLPRTERPEMVFLTRAEFTQLQAGFTDYWHPLVEFLALSGARFGEVSALKPSDVDRVNGTVRISRARKRTYEKGAMYEVGPTKTQRSVRTINVSTVLLDKLDYSGEWLFVNTKGRPLELASWRANVWYKSVKRAQAGGLKKSPRIHDLRHTCASWMIQGGVPLPIVQAHLGHESINTTVSMYVHLDRASHASAADAMATVLYGKGTDE
ncbi:MAG: site-specific integrase [Mycobacterium sp.]|nr:site-specific integrase [Mycobacterium sp.]